MGGGSGADQTEPQARPSWGAGAGPSPAGDHAGSGDPVSDKPPKGSPDPARREPSLVAVVTGPRGSGKTTLLRNLLPREGTPCFIYDATGEWARLPWVRTAATPAEALALWREGWEHIALARRTLDSGEFSALCEFAYARGEEDPPAAIVCDEVARVTSSHDTTPGLSRALCMGRHVGLSLYLATQRPAGIPRAIFSEATDLYCFRTRYLDDAKFLCGMYPELAEHYDGLEHGEYLHVDRAGRVARGSVRKFWR